MTYQEKRNCLLEKLYAHVLLKHRTEDILYSYDPCDVDNKIILKRLAKEVDCHDENIMRCLNAISLLPIDVD